MATQEAGDIHVYNNSQIPTPNQVYRTTVEMEPHTGELYTVQQGPGGGVRMAKSSRVRDDVYAGRRPTHIAEARMMVQGDGSEQISLPHGVVNITDF